MVKKYCLSISGRARRLLVKHYPEFYAVFRKILEDMYPIKAKNGSEAKRLFREQYTAAAVVFELAAELLKITFPEVLRAYPAY